MTRKPTYEELLQKVEELEQEKRIWIEESANEIGKIEAEEIRSVEQHKDDLEKITKLESLINVEELQSIMDDFHNLTGMVTAILDVDGNVIEATGWQDICTQFHRIHPKTAQNCTKSDLYLVKNVKPGEYIEYQCKNGLWDVATPLYIRDKHMGNIYTGQFFYDDDSVDEKKFIQQAEKYGFDKDSYMEAFRRIPRYSREEIKHLMGFLVKFTSYISNISYAKMKLKMEIQERKRAEEERQKLQNQLNQAQKIESVGRLAGGVAHDFNNMLGVILGNCEIIMEDLGSNHKSYSNIKGIQKAARRSADLTRQLLAFARKQTTSPKIIDLNKTIEGMLKMLKRLIGENIDLSWHPKKSLWPVKIDPSQVDQILANLCVNARDAIKDVGKVTIETDTVHFDEDYCKRHQGFQSGDYVLIRISDNGCGMDKETIDNLFEPFYTTKEIGKGTGLGLWPPCMELSNRTMDLSMFTVHPDKGPYLNYTYQGRRHAGLIILPLSGKNLKKVRKQYS